MGRRFEICIDASDPDRLRPFWAAALGYQVQRTSEGALDLVDPDGVAPTIWFQEVSEVKTAKNRLHLDLWLDRSNVKPLIDELRDLGGRVLAEHSRFTVLADPEGNELCVNWVDEGQPATIA